MIYIMCTADYLLSCLDVLKYLALASSLNSRGDIPVYCLKYLPKKLCEGKWYSMAISLMLFPE